MHPFVTLETMRPQWTLLLFLTLLLRSFTFIHAQAFPELAPDGGGEYVYEQAGPCLAEDDRQRIRTAIADNVALLRHQQILPAAHSRSAVSLGWPLTVSPDLDFRNYYGISNYVDHDATPGIRDYDCGSTSYNGHKGTDFFTWPFPWLIYENDFVSVVAAAAGTIVFREDSQEDDHCSWIGNWNAVYVMHADGSIAWYGHLKQNGLTDKNVGDAVEKGEFLGVVASSGRSTGPHLHLELYDANGNLVDPYSGDCDFTGSAIGWDDERPYDEPTINALLTHHSPPQHNCPAVNEVHNISNFIAAGSSVFVGAYYKDQLSGTVAQYTLRRPNGTVFTSWSQTAGTSYNGSWWWWERNLPAGGPFGEWSVEMNYEGQTATRIFTYGVVSGTETPEALAGLSLFPNPTDGSVHWSLDIPAGSRVDIIDHLGRPAGHQTVRENSINMATFAPGVYFLRFRLDDHLISRKIVKQ